jgi:hypothetical protein
LLLSSAVIRKKATTPDRDGANDRERLLKDRVATDSVGRARESQAEERKREERGNRGPEEEDGFGQGA